MVAKLCRHGIHSRRPRDPCASPCCASEGLAQADAAINARLMHP